VFWSSPVTVFIQLSHVEGLDDVSFLSRDASSLEGIEKEGDADTPDRQIIDVLRPVSSPSSVA
jgi:hypothetical protein